MALGSPRKPRIKASGRSPGRSLRLVRGSRGAGPARLCSQPPLHMQRGSPAARGGSSLESGKPAKGGAGSAGAGLGSPGCCGGGDPGSPYPHSHSTGLLSDVSWLSCLHRRQDFLWGLELPNLNAANGRQTPYWWMHACSVRSDSLRPHKLWPAKLLCVHGIVQARILEWVAISSSRGSSRPREPAWIPCIGRRVLYH